MKIKVENIIIGSGVIGLSIAREILQKSKSVLIIDKLKGLGMETSSRNSEVVHCGVYYPENSLKSKMCIQGRRKMYEFVDTYKIPYKKIGKFIVAVDTIQESELETLREKGHRLNIPLEYLNDQKVLDLEPNLKFKKVLLSRETGIVDSHKLMQVLEGQIIEKGGQVVYRTECLKIQGNRVYIRGDTIIEADRIINCAGLDALSLVQQDSGENHKIHYVKGHYIKYNGKSLVNRLIYPMPEKDLKSLGIHCTLDLDGRLKFGPDVKYLKGQEKDYSLPKGQEEIELIDKFYKQVSKYLKEVDRQKMSLDYAGIRPKLSGENEGFKDFVIQKDCTNGVINLFGIESPGLTSSLAIAEYVARL